MTLFGGGLLIFFKMMNNLLSSKEWKVYFVVSIYASLFILSGEQICESNQNLCF